MTRRGFLAAVAIAAAALLTGDNDEEDELHG